MQGHRISSWGRPVYVLLGVAALGLTACEGPFDDASRLSRPSPYSAEGGASSGGEGEESPYCPSDPPKQGDTCPRDQVEMNRCPYITDQCRINDVTYSVETTLICSSGIWNMGPVKTLCEGKDPDEIDAAEAPSPAPAIDAAVIDTRPADSRAVDAPIADSGPAIDGHVDAVSAAEADGAVVGSPG